VSFYGEELLAPCPKAKLEDHLFSAVPALLFKIFAATLHIWSWFLQPIPKDMPCCVIETLYHGPCNILLPKYERSLR